MVISVDVLSFRSALQARSIANVALGKAAPSPHEVHGSRPIDVRKERGDPEGPPLKKKTADLGKR
jgi:hypothetical protein